MLTPGVAGSVVMVIANTLWLEFMIPQKWTALFLSFLFIIPILLKFSASFIENIIYFTFNGLIVFALAVNTNFAGKKLQEINTSDLKVVAQQFVKFKASHASTPTTLDIQVNHNLQFASNSTQGNSSDASGNNQSDSSKNKDNKDNKEKKDKPKQDDRQFFDSWF